MRLNSALRVQRCIARMLRYVFRHSSHKTRISAGVGGHSCYFEVDSFAQAEETAIRPDKFEDDEIILRFIGTGSYLPTVARGASSTALQFGEDIWLFDCGESAILNLRDHRKQPGFRFHLSKIKKIFLTQLKLDHALGLPGMLCGIGHSVRSSSEDKKISRDVPSVDIYGPPGTRDFVRMLLQLTESSVVPPLNIHELKGLTLVKAGAVCAGGKYKPRFHVLADSKERPGNRDILPDGKFKYNVVRPSPQYRRKFLESNLFCVHDAKELKPTQKGGKGVAYIGEDTLLTVDAVPMQSSVPCVGYVVTEPNHPARLRTEMVKNIIEINKKDLMQKYKPKHFSHVVRDLESLLPGETYCFPDGSTVLAENILDPPRKGRKIVIMGDTSSGALMAPFAMGADVLIHESTHTWIPELQNEKDLSVGNETELDNLMIKNGHSTADMAGRFASEIRAKTLILTHFSARYSDKNRNNRDVDITNKIVDRAYKSASKVLYETQGVSASADKNEITVIAAFDAMVYKVKTPQRRWSSDTANNDNNNINISTL